MARIIAVVLLFACCLPAQSFEVASVHLHKDRVQSVSARVAGDKFIGEALSADNIITFAYDLKRYEVAGAPSWADSARTRLETDF